MDPNEVKAALTLLVTAQQAMQEFLTKGMPVLQKAGLIITHMQQTGLEIPTIDERAMLTQMGIALDAGAEAAITQAESEGR